MSPGGMRLMAGPPMTTLDRAAGFQVVGQDEAGRVRPTATEMPAITTLPVGFRRSRSFQKAGIPQLADGHLGRAGQGRGGFVNA